MGIVHNYMNYAPISKVCSSHIAWACGWLNSFWGTQQILEYFSSGRFHYAVPMSSPVSHQEASKPGLDFIGINYYGRSAPPQHLVPCPIPIQDESSCIVSHQRRAPELASLRIRLHGSAEA